jgi:hypothetical protein
MVEFILDVPVFGPSCRASNAGIGLVGVRFKKPNDIRRNHCDRQTPETTCSESDERGGCPPSRLNASRFVLVLVRDIISLHIVCHILENCDASNLTTRNIYSYYIYIIVDNTDSSNRFLCILGV